MQRTTYLVTYDICDPKRLRAVFNICRGFGDHLQYSVFRCDLVPAMKARLIAELDDVIHHREDQVLIVALGPSDGPIDGAFESVGRPYPSRRDRAIIL